MASVIMAKVLWQMKLAFFDEIEIKMTDLFVMFEKCLWVVKNVKVKNGHF